MCTVKIEHHLTFLFAPYPLKFEFWLSLTHSFLQNSINVQLSSSHKFTYPHHLLLLRFLRWILHHFNDFNIFVMSFLQGSKLWEYLFMLGGGISFHIRFTKDVHQFLFLSILSRLGNYFDHIKTSIWQGEMLLKFPHEPMNLQTKN